MATSIASTFLYTPPSSLLPSISTSKALSSLVAYPPTRRRYSTKLAVFASPRASAAPSGTQEKGKKKQGDERVRKVHTVEEFDAALRSAGSRLVVVEYAASNSDESRKIYPFMVELSRTCGDVEFLLVMGDESPETKELSRREKIEKVPHFSFYKGMEKVHEEEGIGPDQLMGDVLYYGDSHSSVVQLHSRQGSTYP